MKRIFIAVIGLLMINVISKAQNDSISGYEMKTIFGNPKAESIGGYGAFGFGYTTINDLDAVSIHGRGMVILNHSIGIGAGGSGFISKTVFDNNLKNDFEFSGGYGGIYFEPIIKSDLPIHLSFPILVGAGGVGYVRHWDDEENNDDHYDYDEDSYAFFVFEPGVEIEFNMVKFMRVAISGSYRITSDVKLKYKDAPATQYGGTAIGSQDMLRSFNVGLVMKFGKF